MFKVKGGSLDQFIYVTKLFGSVSVYLSFQNALLNSYLETYDVRVIKYNFMQNSKSSGSPA